MPAIESLLPFLGISLILALTPGPDNLFVLLQSAMYGARTGFTIVLGLCSGLLVHTAIVAVGVGKMLTASSLAFMILKVAGALYLAYLAWQAFRAPAEVKAAEGSAFSSPWRAYTRGLLMNLSNPKVIVFFLAFLPQFVRPNSNNIAFQIISLGIIFIVVTLLVFSLISFFSGICGKLLTNSPSLQRWLHRIAGLVFLLLAFRLLIVHA
ncbi:LysE family translocator [Klebsiella pneumoniae]|uniref:LysE family translocator n=1 Tax=Klebsiella pneumoniae TaxID=573 RepID=UPI001BA774B5|nr:LysE family translocator [Klebsiella pneumoniae]MBQ5265172.1 LysE family translocator [Klebsiella pneumoniae]